MFALGAVVLLLTGIAFNWRASQPLQLTGAGAVGTAGRGWSNVAGDENSLKQSVQAACVSVSRTLRAAQAALQAGDAGAAPLLDGAMRVVRVLDHAGVSPVTRHLSQTVTTARRRLQNGDPRGAARAAGDAAGLAIDVDPRAPFAVTAPLDRFIDATVVNDSGDHLGRIAGFSGDRVQIERSRFDHLLGFISVHTGRLATMPLERIVFGESHAIGETVALALSDSPSP